MDSEYLKTITSKQTEKDSYRESKSEDCKEKCDFGADFETAISATNFGKFNILLFFLAIPAGWTHVFENTSMSYVFPAAHCDLNLSLSDKGLLNAITFTGMITSGFLWGFLCDTLGRKKLMVIGWLVDACCVIMSSFSQNLTLLIIFKFFGGFVINGPFAALSVYLSEFHSAKYRSRVQLARGIIISAGTMVLPMIALGILPQQITINLYDQSLVLYSWNFFLLVCAIPSLLSGIIFIFMPESPKFLMTVGRNDEALDVFKKVYSLNTGRNKDEFPIKNLIDETLTQSEDTKHGGKITANRSKIQAMKEGLQQIKPVCFPPHVKYIILMCCMQAVYVSCFNTLRLWLPQIFQTISDHQSSNNGTTFDLCASLEELISAEQSNVTCQFNPNSTVYVNTMINALSQIVGYLAAAFLVNKLGKKVLLAFCSVLSGICAIVIYFSPSTVAVVALSSVFLGLGGVCGIVLITIAIDTFPTSLRAVTISLVMTSAQGSSMVGNLIFPVLLTLGCAPPFFSVGSFMIACSLLVVLLPSTEQKSLK